MFEKFRVHPFPNTKHLYSLLLNVDIFSWDLSFEFPKILYSISTRTYKKYDFPDTASEQCRSHNLGIVGTDRNIIVFCCFLRVKIVGFYIAILSY